MTSKAEMKRYLQEHGWSRHQRGYAWRAPTPDRSFFNLEEAYTLAVTSENEPTAPPPPPQEASEDVRL
jgi:hypothetical protein